MNYVQSKPLDKDLAILIIKEIKASSIEGRNPSIEGYLDAEISHQVYAMWHQGLVQAVETTGDTSNYREAIFLNFS